MIMQFVLLTAIRSRGKREEVKMKKKLDVKVPREEFSIEFGDVNGIKLYEILQSTSENKKTHKNKKNKPAH